MPHRARPRLALLVALGACHAAPRPLPPAAAHELGRAPAAQGELVYLGEVVPKGASTPVFHYERRVERGEHQWRSSHLTHELRSDRVVLAQHAVHSPQYELRHFEEIQGQTGVVSSVRVRDDGGLVFTITRGTKVTTRREGPGAPVVVGPTLFGHVLQHWDQLRQGQPLAVRFAATDRARSYAFTLRMCESDPQTTTIALGASSALVRLGIDDMRLVFDTRTRRILSYHGRVPPRLDGRTFDADVRYEFIAAQYH